MKSDSGIGTGNFLLYFGPRIAFGFWLIWLVPDTIGMLLSWVSDLLGSRYRETTSEIMVAYDSLARPLLDFTEAWAGILFFPTIILLYLFFASRAIRKGHMSHTP